MAGESIRAILARAMIRYSPELITWRAAVRGTYCEGYSNMIMPNVKLQPSVGKPSSELRKEPGHVNRMRLVKSRPHICLCSCPRLHSYQQCFFNGWIAPNAILRRGRVAQPFASEQDD